VAFPVKSVVKSKTWRQLTLEGVVMSDSSADTSPESADDSEPHFLADPGVAEAFRHMIDEFARETDRGAILIAGEIVANHLGQLITDLSPETYKEKRVKDPLNYRGSLSSFSARAKFAYTSGFINDTAHRSIDLLRNLRNKAAHSSKAFSLQQHRPTLRDMCDLGPGTASAVSRFALYTIMDSFISSLMTHGVDLEVQLGKNPFSTPAEIIDHLASRPDVIATLENRLPRMELALSTWLLLGLLTDHKKALKRAAS
jgi:hypothetical protein